MAHRYETIEVACAMDKMKQQAIIVKLISASELREAQKRLCYYCLYHSSKGKFYCTHSLLPITTRKEDCPYYTPGGAHPDS